MIISIEGFTALASEMRRKANVHAQNASMASSIKRAVAENLRAGALYHSAERWEDAAVRLARMELKRCG